MRTTLTLDPDVTRLLDEEVHRRRTSLKEVVNDAIRRGLAGPEPRQVEPYRVKPHPGKLMPGLDPLHMNRMVDELEIEDFMATSHLRST